MKRCCLFLCNRNDNLELGRIRVKSMYVKTHFYCKHKTDYITVHV